MFKNGFVNTTVTLDAIPGESMIIPITGASLISKIEQCILNVVSLIDTLATTSALGGPVQEREII